MQNNALVGKWVFVQKINFCDEIIRFTFMDIGAKLQTISHCTKPE